VLSVVRFFKCSVSIFDVLEYHLKQLNRKESLPLIIHKSPLKVFSRRNFNACGMKQGAAEFQ